MKKKNEVRLYNVLFPLWMILLFPQMWLIVIPGNFIIDSLVLLICMAALKLSDKKHFYLTSIWKVFLFGFLADICGAAYMLFMMLILRIGSLGDELYLTIPALIISAALIFVFDYFVSFKNCDKKLRLKISLAFAIATAPYTFLIPSSWVN